MGKKLYFGGTILTMDKSRRKAEAMLTEDGRILAVGNLQELKGTAAEPVDLRGATLMPGFVDGHSHIVSMGLNLTKQCSLAGCGSFEELLERIRNFASTHDLTQVEPIVCKGYDLAVMKEGVHPTAALLDSLGLDNPIACIHMSGHVAAYNSVAMAMAGIDEDTYVCPAGGFAGRDEKGKLNGYFEENARAVFSPIFNAETTDAEIEAAFLTAQEEYIKHGYTTIQEGSANDGSRIRLLQQLAAQGKLKVDVVAYMHAAPKAVPQWEEALAYNGRDYKNRLKLGGVKLFLDGSPQVRTAWLRQPYEGEKEYRGYPRMTDEQAARRLELAVEYGLQPMAHCNGDAASEQFLSAWEAVTARKKPERELRPVMIHAQTVGYDQLDRMAKSGMMASFFVGHCFYWGDTHRKNLGQRGMRISPTKQAMQRGVAFDLHQDCPVTNPDMLHSVWCAVNRMTRSGVCVGEDNRLDVYDALIAATHGGAYSYFEEDTKGILKPGAVADFVILDHDPTAVDPMEIKNIRVLATVKEDAVIYRCR